MSDFPDPHEGTVDPRSAPAVLALTLATALGAAGLSVVESPMSTVHVSGSQGTTPVAASADRVTDREVMYALARIHDELTTNATVLDAEVQELIHANLRELYA